MFFDGWKFITCDGFPKWAKGFQKENKTGYLENELPDLVILVRIKWDFDIVMQLFSARK